MSKDNYISIIPTQVLQEVFEINDRYSKLKSVDPCEYGLKLYDGLTIMVKNDFAEVLKNSIHQIENEFKVDFNYKPSEMCEVTFNKIN